jgi:hypothetical protein
MTSESQNSNYKVTGGSSAFYAVPAKWTSSSITSEQNMIMSSMELRTKNHCAGEDQQQFNRQSVSH